MAASPTLWPKCRSPRSIPSLVQHRLLPPTRSFHQQASAQLINITHRPAVATPFTTHLSQSQPKSRASNRRRRAFMSSSERPAPQEEQPQPRSISGKDWDDLSPEAKIQWLGDDKWGWVIFRCSYAKEFDGAWDDLRRRIQQGMRESIARSDAPAIAETMDFVFVEDPAALEGASVETLRRRFRNWAHGDNTAGSFDMDDDGMHGSRGSRHEFFLKVDGEGLWNGYVGLIRAWPDSPGSEDWMKVRTGAVGPALYVQLDNPEAWSAYYMPPEAGVCNAW